MKLSSFLEQELSLRKKRNTKYSGRAFARDMGISSSFCNQLLRGTAKLSMEKALLIIKNLNLPPEKAELFELVVQLSNATSENEIKTIQIALKEEMQKELNVEMITEAQFRAISKWYVGAVFALVVMKNGEIDGRLIAETFNVSKEDADELLADLVTVGFLKIEHSRYVKSSPWYKIADTPSHYIQKYHLSHLENAKKSLLEHPVNMRDVSGNTICFDSSKLSEIKEIIKEFRDKISKYEIEIPPEKIDSIYHLGVQFCRLDSLKEG